MPLDGADALAANFVEGDALRSMLSARPPARVIDLRRGARAKAPSMEELAAASKQGAANVLLMADHELQARIAREKLLALGVPAAQIFVVRGSVPSIQNAKQAPKPAKH